MPQKRMQKKLRSSSISKYIEFPLIPPIKEEITSIPEFERFLDEVAGVVKGNVGDGKEKAFLLPLLFHKYFSDLSYTSFFNDNSFHFPPDYRWENIYSHLMENSFRPFITSIMRDIASFNPRLRGALDLTDYTEYSDALLKNLIILIDRYQMNLFGIPNLWSKAYERLLQHFPEKNQDRKKSFYTSIDVVKLIVNLIKPGPNAYFYDPACGSGCLNGFFHCLSFEGAEQIGGMRFLGQDQASIAFAATKMDLLFNDNVKFLDNNALCEPPCKESGDLRSFDYIIANPPWNQSGHNRGFYATDPWARFHYGLPKGRSADWGWIQAILHSLDKASGKALVILDLGALSRGSNVFLDSEREIRASLIELDLIEAVITLPGNLFYGTSAPGCLLLFASNKPESSKGKVLFIDAQNFFPHAKSSKRIGLKTEEIDAIVETYLQQKVVKDFSDVASLEIIRSNDYDLNPILYVSEEIQIDYRSPDIIEQELITICQERKDADLALFNYPAFLGQPPAPLETLLNVYARAFPNSEKAVYRRVSKPGNALFIFSEQSSPSIGALFPLIHRTSLLSLPHPKQQLYHRKK